MRNRMTATRSFLGFIHGGERDGQMDGFWCHPYFCSCSNQRCIACNIFPSKSREEAVERFCAGDFAHEDDFIELKTGKRYHYSQYGIEQQILRYLAHWSAEQVKGSASTRSSWTPWPCNGHWIAWATNTLTCSTRRYYALTAE